MGRSTIKEMWWRSGKYNNIYERERWNELENERSDRVPTIGPIWNSSYNTNTIFSVVNKNILWLHHSTMLSVILLCVRWGLIEWHYQIVEITTYLRMYHTHIDVIIMFSSERCFHVGQQHNHENSAIEESVFYQFVPDIRMKMNLTFAPTHQDIKIPLENTKKTCVSCHEQHHPHTKIGSRRVSAILLYVMILIYYVLCITWKISSRKGYVDDPWPNFVFPSRNRSWYICSTTWGVGRGSCPT